jgi:hypothetical protein
VRVSAQQQSALRYASFHASNSDGVARGRLLEWEEADEDELDDDADDDDECLLRRRAGAEEGAPRVAGAPPDGGGGGGAGGLGKVGSAEVTRRLGRAR